MSHLDQPIKESQAHSSNPICVFVHSQFCSEQSAHLCHVLIVVHVTVYLVPTQLPLGGADRRRASPVAGD